MIDFYLQKPLRLWFLLALGPHLAAAWFSLGFLHPDEQWQILTPLHLKLTGGSFDQLTWEFRHHIRPFFQIILYYPLISYLTFQRWLHERYPHPVTYNVEIEPDGKRLSLNPLYQRPQTRVVGIPDLKSAEGFVLTSQIRQFKLMRVRKECRLLHSHYPSWILQEKYNLFSWNTRSSIWVPWECLP